MAPKKGIVEEFRACRGPFPWRKFVQLLRRLGYKEVKRKGKTAGSRIKFYHEEMDHVILAHAPHDGEMGPGMVKELRSQLEDKGVL